MAVLQLVRQSTVRPGGEASFFCYCNSCLLGIDSPVPGSPRDQGCHCQRFTHSLLCAAGQGKISGVDRPQRTAASCLKILRCFPTYALMHTVGAGRGEQQRYLEARRGRAAASPGTYALQAVLALHRLHAAGADAVAELLQMLLYLTNFPRKKNDDKIPSPCSAAVWIVII